jgi:branched-chain amino acid transport system permease protein
MIWVNVIIQGVLLGGFYALLACGLSLLFGVMRIINLAHGGLVVLGAFVAWALVDVTKQSPFLIIIPTVVVMFGIGYALQRGLFERSLRAGLLIPLLTTFGLSIVIENALLQIFSPDVRALGQQAGKVAVSSFNVTSRLSVSVLGLLILGVAVAVLGGLQFFLTRTSLGRSIRATAQDPDTAELVGINSRAVYARAAGIAMAITAIAGVFLAIRASVAPSSGPAQLIFAFEAVVIGGTGSLWGTLPGGIILGLAQTISTQLNPQYGNLGGHVVFLIALALRSWTSLGTRKARA